MKYKLQPEWMSQKGVLLALPDNETDWEYMLPQVINCYIDILTALVKHNVKVILLARNPDFATSVLPEELIEKIRLVKEDYNDTWIRDYGPLTLKSENGNIRLADFGFNGWGLKFAADKDNLVINRLYGPGSPDYPENGYRNFLGYILEGGSVEVNSDGVLLTTTRCLCSKNRNGGLSKEEVEKILVKTLGINKVLWLDYGELEGDDTDSHIDTLARMCPDNTILYVGCTDKNDVHYPQLKLMKEQLSSFRTASGEPYRLIELPLPDAILDSEDGHRLPATYANYLVTERAILVPVYGQPEKDRQAQEAVKMAYPQHIIEPVDCNALIRQHGSLHCATMQLNK